MSQAALPMLNFFNPKPPRIFIGQREAIVLPGIGIESATDFPGVCTEKPLPAEIPDGFIAVFNDSDEWELQRVFKGPFYQKETGAPVEFLSSVVGVLPEGVTDQKPLPCSSWSEEAGGWLLDMDQYRQPRLVDVERAYFARLAAGFLFQGRQVQADADSQQKINGAATLALLAQQTNEPYSIAWTCADNSTIELDAVGLLAMARACGTFVTACFYRRQALKGALRAADTTAAIDAIDVAAGWPGDE